jgi:hypothetical protein
MWLNENFINYPANPWRIFLFRAYAGNFSFPFKKFTQVKKSSKIVADKLK